ncbi:MAG: hypothetical protein V1774_05235 [Candidatus Eisenbacteria bacterium]
MNRSPRLLRRGRFARVMSAAGVFLSILLSGAVPAIEAQETACPACPPKTHAPGDSLPLYVASSELGIVCIPARIAYDEGRWTFFLRGKGIIGVTGAQLEVAGARIDASRIDLPTPFGLLIDFLLPPLTPGARARLILIGTQGELGRLPIDISGPAMVPIGHRQPDFVRVQLAEGTLFYPLHQTGQVDARSLDEVGGDEEFLALLRDMGIRRIRKTLSNIAEGDSVQWDERNHRELLYGGTQLRSYLIYLNPDRSQEAFREIFRAFRQVEAGWVNEDMATRVQKRQGGK